MTTFLVLGVVGLVVLGVSLLLGDFFDGVLDALAGDVFSSAVLGAFLAAFGFSGALTEALGMSVLVSVLVGTAAGAAASWFAAWLTRLIREGGSDATLVIEDTLGRDGKVVTGIPVEGYGVVRVLVGGHSLQLNARATGPLEAGTPVHVTEVLSPTSVTVAPLWNDLPAEDSLG